MAVKKHLDEIRKGVKGLANEGKKTAYGVASKIERTVTGEGGLVDDAKDLAGKVVSGVKEFHESIQEKGGYGAAAKEAAGQVIEAVRGAYGSAEEMYSDFQKTFFPDGRFDSDKAKEVLKDKAEVTKRFGERAARDLSYLVKEGSKLVTEGAKAIGKDYRDYIPSREERAGIGDKYHGIITREHLDECISYEAQVRKKLPGGLKARPQILEDLRAYAAVNKSDLTKLYNEGDSAYEAVKKYLR